MKKLIMPLAFFASFATFAAHVGNVVVRQQWPWSTDVVVECLLSDNEGATSQITLKAWDGGRALDSDALMEATKGPRVVTGNQVLKYVIDPVKAFGTSQFSMPEFKVEVSAETATGMDDVVYKIFDLTNGACEDVTRAQLLNGEKGRVETKFGRIGSGFTTPLEDVLIWTDVTNNPSYKDEKLVMRLVKAKDVVWTMGAKTTEFCNYDGSYSPDEIQHQVKLTNDFYIAVFPLTKAQYDRIGNGLGAWQGQMPAMFPGGNEAYGPATTLAHETVRGEGYETASGEKYTWPQTGYQVHPESVAGRMRAKLGVQIDFPTETQWEFACRAGTTTALYNGHELTTMTGDSDGCADMMWANPFCFPKDAWGDYRLHEVGGLAPNAYGLYDMCGLGYEICLDWAAKYETSCDVSGVTIDPVGANAGELITGFSAAARVSRGGSVYTEAVKCRSAARWPSSNGVAVFRPCFRVY